VALVLLACACNEGRKRVDFSDGGGEIELVCRNERNVAVDSTRVQEVLARALPKAAFETTDVRRPASDGREQAVATRVSTNLVAASHRGSAQHARDAVLAQLADRGIVKAAWSGDRLHVRSKQPIAWQEVALLIAGAGFELKAWTDEETRAFAHPDVATGEYTQVFTLAGLDRQVQRIIEQALDVRCQILRFETVGPQGR
jgi:hypothetical protein